MGDTWCKLEKKETNRKVTKTIDGESYEYFEHENCRLCYETGCVLVGKYGTYNAFGSFNGICLECLKKLNKLSKAGA